MDGLPLFSAFWDRNAEIPTAGGKEAEFVEGAVNASSVPERDLSVQLAGWMLMEAAHSVDSVDAEDAAGDQNGAGDGEVGHDENEDEE